MEWVYLILVVTFVVWSVQILVGYRRQVGQMDQQIQNAHENLGEATEQTERYEARFRELGDELERLREQATDWEKKEKELKERVNSHRQQDAVRRPTRHRVHTQNPDSQQK